MQFGLQPRARKKLEMLVVTYSPHITITMTFCVCKKFPSLLATFLCMITTSSITDAVWLSSDDLHVVGNDWLGRVRPRPTATLKSADDDTVRSSSTASSAPSSSVLDIRGGGSTTGTSPGFGGVGWIFRNPFGASSMSTAQIYRASLEEQVDLLEQQLRKARNEVTALKAKAREAREQQLDDRKTKTLQRHERSRQKTLEEMEELKQERERHQAQRQELARLQLEISQLESMKSELEILLEVATAKIESLEEKLKSENGITEQLQKRYEAQIERLQRELDTKQQQSLERLEALYERKVQDAVKAALEEQEAKLQRQMAQLTQDMQQRHMRDLDAERRKSEAAIEAERQKMRKLVRALALREKKLVERSRRLGIKQDQIRDEDAHDDEIDNSRVSVSGGPPSSKRPVGQSIPVSTPVTRGRI